jgi:hypothetical protein
MDGLFIVDSVVAYFNNFPDWILIVSTDLKIKKYLEDESRINYRTFVRITCANVRYYNTG